MLAKEAEGSHRPILVVAPTVLVVTWFNEIQKHFGNALAVRFWHSSKSRSGSSSSASGLGPVDDGGPPRHPELKEDVSDDVYKEDEEAEASSDDEDDEKEWQEAERVDREVNQAELNTREKAEASFNVNKVAEDRKDDGEDETDLERDWSAHSTAQRNATVAEFNDPDKRIDALVCSLRTSAHGLNFQNACHRLVHMEVPSAMGTLHQANGRLHRLGQKHKQHMHILTTDATYDMFLQHRLAAKYLPELMGTVAIP